jgi:ABC-2 type transport system ATP-binding protein
VWDRIAAVRAETGMTVLLTTHYMEEAEQSCDRVGLMHRGRLGLLGTPGELIDGLGRPDGTLEDVFRAYSGGSLEEEQKGLRDVRATRRTAGRLG